MYVCVCVCAFVCVKTIIGSCIILQYDSSNLTFGHSR